MGVQREHSSCIALHGFGLTIICIHTATYNKLLKATEIWKYDPHYSNRKKFQQGSINGQLISELQVSTTWYMYFSKQVLLLEMYNFTQWKRRKSNTHLSHQNTGEGSWTLHLFFQSNSCISCADTLFRHQKGASEKMCLNPGNYFICWQKYTPSICWQSF